MEKTRLAFPNGYFSLAYPEIVTNGSGNEEYVNVEDSQLAAERRLPQIAFDYLEPSAEDEVTCT